MGRMDQLYVCISEMVERPPALPMAPEDLHKQHLSYLQDLLDRKLLIGSGSAKDEKGQRHGGGIMILRAASHEAAIDLAGQEPYTREKQRVMNVIPWQRTWFGD